MDLVRVRAPFARLADVVALTSRWHVLFQCSDAASATLARERAALLVAMLSDDRIDLRNDAATIVGAYNRPAPPSPITVWGWDGTVLAGAEGERRVTSSTLVDGLEVTTFASA